MKRCVNPACNAEMEDNETCCPECGTEQTPKQPKRHGCITAWLYFCLVVTVLLIGAFFRLNAFLGEENAMPISVIIVALAQSICCLIGYILLLRWRKIGFYLIAVSVVIGSVVSCVLLGEGMWTLIKDLISIPILYAVLQITTDGVPYWDSLK